MTGVQTCALPIRPNPLGGTLIEGPMLENGFESFIGVYPIPYIYGMTIGELALYFNSEFDINCDCHVVQMQNWQRSMIFKETGLPWVPTSPHVPHPETAFYLAALGCLGELQVVNEGVGYTLPFELIGAPFINAESFAADLNNIDLSGVQFRPAYYSPYYTDWKSKSLQGVQMHISNFKEFRPMRTQIAIMILLRQQFPDFFQFRPERIRMFEKAIGTDRVQRMIQEGQDLDSIYRDVQAFMNSFLKTRDQYLLY